MMMVASASHKKTCSLKISLASPKSWPIPQGIIAQLVSSIVSGNMGSLSDVFLSWLSILVLNPVQTIQYKHYFRFIVRRVSAVLMVHSELFWGQHDHKVHKK